MQDIYPWAGEIRTTEVGAMGMAMCRTQFVDRELRPAVTAVGEGASGSLGATEGSWDNRTAAEIFHGMMESRRR
ncbi:MAG: hypothetical protein ACTH1D_06160 [Mycobacteriaceae bacterium]|uniref:hypothetical protein n=1 Tax=Corynebacterium sp. TaxID=1720 RepID=UPI003F998C30